MIYKDVTVTPLLAFIAVYNSGLGSLISPEIDEKHKHSELEERFNELSTQLRDLIEPYDKHILIGLNDYLKKFENWLTTLHKAIIDPAKFPSKEISDQVVKLTGPQFRLDTQKHFDENYGNLLAYYTRVDLYFNRLVHALETYCLFEDKPGYSREYFTLFCTIAKDFDRSFDVHKATLFEFADVIRKASNRNHFETLTKKLNLNQ